jgi:AraC family transcriptional regulator
MFSAALVIRGTGEVNWRSDYHRIVYALTDIPGTVQSEGGRERPLGLLQGFHTFTRTGVSTRCVLRPGSFVQILQSQETYDNVGSDFVCGGFVDLQPVGATNNPLVSRIVLTIINEIKGGFLDRILADALNTALAVQITRRFVDQAAINLAPSNGLSRERLQRVRDYVEAHLDEELSLTVLADIACLSPYHFSRSFKQTAGVGPQHYVIQRRVERAKTLMRRTNQPLALIAQEAGFADQSHLTAIFHRETGVTPGRFRAALA